MGDGFSFVTEAEAESLGPGSENLHSIRLTVRDRTRVPLHVSSGCRMSLRLIKLVMGGPTRAYKVSNAKDLAPRYDCRYDTPAAWQ